MGLRISIVKSGFSPSLIIEDVIKGVVDKKLRILTGVQCFIVDCGMSFNNSITPNDPRNLKNEQIKNVNAGFG